MLDSRTCAASGLAGLYLAPGADTRDPFGIGFIALALAWLYTGTNAFRAIRSGEIGAHRRWMIRNYALTYAAVTLRLEIPILIVVGGVAPIVALNIVAWLCWVPNLLAVEVWLRRRGAVASCIATRQSTRSAASGSIAVACRAGK